MDLHVLTSDEQNVLIASILGDGEITKRYPGSRRKNNSYREHFSIQQLDYRIWKLNLLPPTFYFNKSCSFLVSPSLPLLTQMFNHFYNSNGDKIVSLEMLKLCKSPLFLTTLFLDDGSLSISVSKNHLKKTIYLTPHIHLYLQCLSLEDLCKLKLHIHTQFSVEVNTSKRSDGFGYILKTTKVCETMKFLKIVGEVSRDCPSMYHKTDWEFRFSQEVKRYQESYPGYEVIVSSSDRKKNYTEEECEVLCKMKREGRTDKEIAAHLNRPYWSVVYKWAELRKNNSEYILPD
ncbi:DNA endonuclease [Planococcus sp. APC 3900]|uniref:DNA endonuclease n=1 Tax=Planococcus sp. APC 3900 TaxID=3035191 RepID=UPI0025B526DE|nr:DNA endonuclease [Planococcus sp. APC 3900]MDN3439172.1 DNA endonuclease [Planococcus sp. APC 3900]